MASLGGGTPAGAAILSNVPMQGTMVMPMIRYDAGEHRLHVMVDPAIPQLTPLLVSNPLDLFDQGDPWFTSLDPRAQGLAFSRRYGFVMDAATDPLPSGTGILLRKTAGPPDLGVYRYRSSNPKLWEPIFGTADSRMDLLWDGMMFHPCFVAPPGTNTYSARFEALLVETGTGAEIPGSGTGVFEMNWTSASDGRPNLEIGLRVAIVLPSGSEWMLEASEGPTSGTWMTVTNVPIAIDGRSTVLLPPEDSQKTYRMRKAP